MPDEKGLGSKILGLFIEHEHAEAPSENTDADGGPEEPREKSAAELVAELAQQSGRPPKQAPAPPPPARAAPGPVATTPLPPPPANVAPAQVDFDAVFRNAGMDAGELDRVRKAEELLKSLPEATPQDVKRQIVEASLKAFGFDIAKIVSAAQNQQKALETYVKVNEQATAKGLTDAQKQIAELEDKVISLRAEMTKRTEQLAAVTLAATARRGQVAQVLEFFHVTPAAPAPGAKS
jgi:cell division protein FtsB